MKRILAKENKQKRLISDKKFSPKTLKLFFLGLIFFLILFPAEIWVVNRLSTYGDKIYQLKKDQSKLELENKLLANNIAKNSSLAILEEKAKKLGFDNLNKIEYIKASSKLASVK